VRLFVAVTPPPEVLDRVAELARPEREGVRWTTPDQWHVTLRFLGDVSDPEPVEAALRAVRWPAARMRIGPGVASLGRHAVVLPVAGLEELARLAAESTVAFAEPEQRPFRGHLTLARVRRGSPAPLTGERFEAEAEVEAVALFRSRLHPEGARYEELASVRLRPSGPGA
jgi:RNA 2',3'-cyclic 3'-phosphodiesterase